MEELPNATAVRDPASRRQLAGIVAASVLAVAVIGWFGFWRSDMKPRAVLRGEGDTWPLAFTPDGRAFASSGSAGVTLWNTLTGKARSVWANPSGAYAAMGAFSPDGRKFAGTYFHERPKPLTVELRDCADGRVVWSVLTKQDEPPLAAPSRPVNCGSGALAATRVCLYTALQRRGSVALNQLVLFARHKAWPERHRPCHW